MIHDRKLAELALEAGWVSLEELKTWVPQARSSNQPLACVFPANGLDEDRITYLQAGAFGLAFVRPDRLNVPRRAAAAIPIEVQRKYRVVPLRLEPGVNGDTVYFASLPECAADLATFLSESLGIIALPVAAPASSLARALDPSHVRPPSAEDAHAMDLDSPADPKRYTPAAASEPRAVRRRLEMDRPASEEMIVTSLAEI